MRFSYAKKHLGQNFLVDAGIKKRIISNINIQDNDVILEIGPGQGTLTQAMLARGATVYAVEKDPDMVGHLKTNLAQDRLHLITGDISAQDLSEFPALTKIVGNIPYNISTPIIEWLIRFRSYCPHAFLTVQREFAQRLIAQPHTKDYGSLSCFIQYYAKVTPLFQISPQAFRPAPKVTSSFIHILFRDPPLKAQDEALLFRVTQAGFQKRRKKIINALAGLFDKELLEKVLRDIDITPGSRAENITIKDFIRLANALGPYAG